MTLLKKLKQMDYTIVGIVACFAVLSTLIIQSATEGTRFDGLHKDNLIMYGALFLPMLLIAMADYRFIVRYLSYLSYLLGIGLLILVLTSGVTLNGATRWIEIGSQQVQPSEFMKIAFILMLAKFLGDRQGNPLRFWKDIVPVLGMFMVPFYLIFKQPDLGTAVVFISILISILWVTNIKWQHILIGITSIAIMIAMVTATYFVNFDLFSKIVKPHQLERIQTFLDPSVDPDNSWHVDNAKLAIGTGELFGKGFKNGFYVQNGYVPYHYADSIFVVVAEEFGFLGCAVLLLLYLLLIYRMILIAYASDFAGSCIVVGVTAMFVLQIFENIAMHTGLMPLTGIALPFISYGGSSLLTNMVSIGLALSVKLHRDPLKAPA